MSKTFFRRNTDVFQEKMTQRSAKRPAVRVRWELEEYTLRKNAPQRCTNSTAGRFYYSFPANTSRTRAVFPQHILPSGQVPETKHVGP